MSSRSKAILDLAISNFNAFQDGATTQNIATAASQLNCQTVLIPDDDLRLVLDEALGSNSIINSEVSNTIIDGRVYECPEVQDIDFNSFPTETTSAFEEGVLPDYIIENGCEDSAAEPIMGTPDTVVASDIDVTDVEGENLEFHKENMDVEQNVGEANEDKNSGNSENMDVDQDVGQAEHSSSAGERKKNYCGKKKKTLQIRIRGVSYIGYKRTSLKVITHGQIRDARSIKGRCSHNSLPKKKTNSSFMCTQITDEDRKNIFDNFWKNHKTWHEKKAYIKGLVATRDIKRRRKEVTGKHFKSEGHDLFLPTGTGQKVKVCRFFFLNTIDLGRDTFMRWVKRDKRSSSPSVSENGEETATVIKDKVQINKAKKVREWLDLLPKVPSHYCRASTTKKYVESTFRSYLHMYDVYKKWCTVNELVPVGRVQFTGILKKDKIAIHHPRKDQCDTCCGFKVGTVGNEEYTNHIKRKDDARVAKRAAKESANSEKLVITMDLQSVLLCPKTEASAMYYKQKLQVHNFTIYELNKGDVHLYVWHEANGGVSSNEFTSCIIHYLSTAISETYKHVVLISDGCNYQNRNKILASALSDLAKTKSIIIEQLILEKGHTMMEADSVHATLEQYFKPPINAPSDYIARMRLARPKQPYNVNVVDFNFFLKYEDLATNLSSLRPGKKTGDPTVTDIRQLRYLPNGEICFQLGYAGEWNPLPQRRKPGTSVPKKMYCSELPIAESKFRHLQELRSVIEKDHHAFYNALKFKPDSKKSK